MHDANSPGRTYKVAIGCATAAQVSLIALALITFIFFFSVGGLQNSTNWTSVLPLTAWNAFTGVLVPYGIGIAKGKLRDRSQINTFRFTLGATALFAVISILWLQFLMLQVVGTALMIFTALSAAGSLLAARR
ncbi:hypothetical protein [Rhodococcus sp. H29-C3]|uniref:hypothetical protein n=1 Tax=Rhodococcus sp. H29-C3 TaxID=3046307 RepID=UPI0024BBA350|nr:hypothetical protein [Rhodococcus sp. H29-C3]MDJ0363001.1 hypothetical protein [Rhodococcus sp. H29-C3]